MRLLAGTLTLTFSLLAFCGTAGAVPGPAGHVDVFAGTRPGSGDFGGGNLFPGATMPFGMVQFSPDTTPDGNPGAYDYRDDQLTGFSLTHLSGAGCPLYADFPFLPTTEPLNASPVGADGSLRPGLVPSFSHAQERGSPGYYATRLRTVAGDSIGVGLSATTRTGVARFSFPASASGTVLVNAGGSAQADNAATVGVVPGAAEIDGSASSGAFCGQRPRYRVYFAAVFDRPFASWGTWRGTALEPGSTAAEESSKPTSNPRDSAQAGAYVGFHPQAGPITAKVGISFVSVADARANLAAESGGGFDRIKERAQTVWNKALGRIKVSGGSERHLDTFYTALYHALLAPRTFSDVGGAYIGMDGAVHRAKGYVQYTDFSGWDIYRSEIQLLALVEPARTGDMMRSLLVDAAQSGCLPRWPFANGQTMTAVGDSADPILASAAAFGARFDRRAALRAMVRGATRPCRSPNGEYVERQGLPQYLQLGYVPFDIDTGIHNANTIVGDPEAVWASASTTLEYQIDDFAIAQLAARYLHDKATYRTMIKRSGMWRRLYNPVDERIEPRLASGAFVTPEEPGSRTGFAEGDSAQYTWMVPQDPAGLIARMGDRTQAASRLHYFLRELNGGQGGAESDHALLGNEPTLATPWLYDWMGRPWATQEAVRRGLGLLQPDPGGYPGNDDLGTFSAWYVFGALGIYPEVPGVGLLALASPLFHHAQIELANHKRLTIDAKGRGTYVNGLRFDGHRWPRPWIGYCSLAHGGTFNFELQPRPNRRWGAELRATPPSFGPRRRMPRDPCAL